MLERFNMLGISGDRLSRETNRRTGIAALVRGTRFEEQPLRLRIR